MHKHFSALVAAASAHNHKTSEEMLKDLESTIAHAAREQLGAFRDEDVRVTVDPASGALHIYRNGNEVNLDTLGRIHHAGDDLSSRTPNS